MGTDGRTGERVVDAIGGGDGDRDGGESVKESRWCGEDVIWRWCCRVPT